MVNSFFRILTFLQQSPKRVYAFLMDLEKPPYNIFSIS